MISVKINALVSPKVTGLPISKIIKMEKAVKSVWGEAYYQFLTELALAVKPKVKEKYIDRRTGTWDEKHNYKTINECIKWYLPLNYNFYIKLPEEMALYLKLKYPEFIVIVTNDNVTDNINRVR